MYTEYPNLPLLEEKFLNEAKEDIEKAKDKAGFYYPDLQFEVFRQAWPTSLGGFYRKDEFSKMDLIFQYTSVLYDARINFYGVAFGNRIAYWTICPNEAFMNDFRNQEMKDIENAAQAYSI